MDLGFTRFERWRQGASPVALDHARLLAGLSAAQATSATARAEALLASEAPRLDSAVDALTCVIGARPCWEDAAAALGGSFDPLRAGGSFAPFGQPSVKSMATNMKGAFTVAR